MPRKRVSSPRAEHQTDHRGAAGGDTRVSSKSLGGPTARAWARRTPAGSRPELDFRAQSITSRLSHNIAPRARRRRRRICRAHRDRPGNAQQYCMSTPDSAAAADTEGIEARGRRRSKMTRRATESWPVRSAVHTVSRRRSSCRPKRRPTLVVRARTQTASRRWVSCAAYHSPTRRPQAAGDMEQLTQCPSSRHRLHR